MRLIPMATGEPTPTLNHSRLEWNNNNPHGFIHLRKRDGEGRDLKTEGYVRGTNLKIGLKVKVCQNTRLWNGTIVSGPAYNNDNQEYWTFDVTSTVDADDPIQDDTITVTVSNPVASPTDSNPQPADPQPIVLDP
jgi:hypothetical protein